MWAKIEPALPATAGFGHIPGLNGLRALSVFIVIIAHMGFAHIVPGGFGVTMFFFISGFLITRLLLAEDEKDGRINLPKFYTRRLIRLYPALLFMIFGTTALYGALGYGGPKPLELAAGIFYFTNVYQVHLDTIGQASFMPWKPLWSLAVEEHFYLAFPLLVFGLKKHYKWLAASLIAVIIGAVFWRAHILLNTDIAAESYNYMMSDARMDSLAWGCLLSVLLHIKGSARPFKRLIGALPFILALGGLVASFVLRDDTFRYTVRFSLQGLCIFVLMLNLYYWRTLGFALKILDFKPLAWFGLISYPLYLWHMPILDLLGRAVGDSMALRGLAILLSIGVAAISYYWVETPFLALRRRFGSHAGLNTPNTAKPKSVPTPEPMHPAIARWKRLTNAQL